MILARLNAAEARRRFAGQFRVRAQAIVNLAGF